MPRAAYIRRKYWYGEEKSDDIKQNRGVTVALEKFNSMVLSPSRGRAYKQFANAEDATTELQTLLALDELRAIDTKLSIRAPRVYPEESTTYRLSMDYLPSIRCFDFLALCRKLVEEGASDADQYATWATTIKEKALADLRVYQSSEVQYSLAARYGQMIQAYPYRDKLFEAAKYLEDSIKVPVGDDTLKGFSQLSTQITSHPRAGFRDAILKNLLFDTTDIADSGKNVSEEIEHRPTDFKMTDVVLAKKLRGSQSLASEISDRLIHVDFEQSRWQIARDDDILHIQGFEHDALSICSVCRQISVEVGATEPQVLVTIVARLFREWVRRFFYARERPITFATRYVNERPALIFEGLRSAISSLLDVYDNREVDIKSINTFVSNISERVHPGFVSIKGTSPL